MENLTKLVLSSSVRRTALKVKARPLGPLINNYFNAIDRRGYNSCKTNDEQLLRVNLGRTTTTNNNTIINNVDSRNCSTFMLSVRSCSSEPDEGQQNAWTDLSYEDLCALIKGGDVQLFDVREPKELREYGKIPNAVNIPLGQLYDALRMPNEKFEGHFGVEKPNFDDDNIVFTCLGGVRSHKALLLSNDIGYKKVRHYKGGWEEWSSQTNQPLKKS